ncbi:hypothetical protein OZN62_00635 [Aurantiacibacter sp. MUD11]|uniref:hypothetical protein n=1 Tax=Aurantiacibacter sp. MUD11 TaxID=3003265 RepID=UPI0022AAF13E|nr:hypothetical protein [Aurantiacibacter sp. MUD11]WAT18116.1 hypothetical protein OZN62_00635 [Aurantiacibacter sp. MUD11]
MMLRKFTLSAAALALALPLGATPALAQQKGLTCMESAYTDSQRSEIAELGPQVRFGDGNAANPAADRLGSIAMAAVEQCITRHGWNEELAMYAAFYELGRLNNIAYRASGELTPTQLRQIDDALATGDRTRLWEAIERGLMGGMTGQDSAPPAGDAITLGAFVLGAGLGDDEANAVKVGILLGFMGLQRVGEREFRSLQ